MLSFNFLTVYLNQIFSALHKNTCLRFKADVAFLGHLFCIDLPPFCPSSLQTLLLLEFAVGTL